MKEFLNKILPRGPKSYEEQRDALKSADVKARLKLAKSAATSPEILYYLAENDPDARVRRAVAENKNLPVQASPVLAGDRDQDVRLTLAGRLMDLLPNLSQDEQSKLYAIAVQALGTLALDEVLKIRKALSSTLKDHAHAPPKVAGQLARDVEREVSEPILRFCAALSDHDLLDILKSHPASWVIESIAGRKAVSSSVAGAVIDTRDMPGGRALIKNEGAELTEKLLLKIVNEARDTPEWHEPIAVRKLLPVEIARELAEFVDASVRDMLLSRSDFDEAMIEEIAAVFRRRLDFATSGQSEEERRDPAKRVMRLKKEGALDDAAVSDAVAMRDKAFVVEALAVMGGTNSMTVKKILDMRAPKAVVALCWKCGLSMRTALQVQKDLLKIDAKELLYPKGGTDYPLKKDEIDWQLDFLGLQKK